MAAGEKATLTVTVSVGMAAATTSIGPTELIARADAALYIAKSTGRDQVSVAPDPTGVPMAKRVA